MTIDQFPFLQQSSNPHPPSLLDINKMDEQELIRRREEKIIELKTRRAELINKKIIDWMNVERALASEVCKMIIKKANSIPDPLIPALGGLVPEKNKFYIYRDTESRRTQSVSCCTIV